MSASTNRFIPDPMTFPTPKSGFPAFALFGLFLLIALISPSVSLAEELIKEFRSDLWIHGDASLMVREQITVISEGRQIRRGIYRDFPTDYKDSQGNQYRVGFEVEEVTRDGRPEPFLTERLSNGVRVYIGNKDVLIPPGQHSYTITYKTTRQIGYFDEIDELYWNVTGNGWAFTIEKASARVHLPAGARVQGFIAYTGYQGDRGNAFGTRDYADGMEFFTTKPLHPQEGLTIAVSWPSGFVARPTGTEKLSYLLSDNNALFIGIIGLLVLNTYYLLVWWRVGRDPAAGTIIPFFEPPQGYSPAAMRYIRNMGFDNKVFSAAILSMAVKGYLTIEEDSFGTYTLKRTGEKAPLSMGEKAVAQRLFSSVRDQIELKQKNHSTLQSARDGLKEWLRTEFEKTYFNNNRQYFLPGVGLSIFIILLMIIWAPDPGTAAFISIWLAGWTAGVYFILRRGYRAVLDFINGRNPFSGVGAIILSIMAIPFLGGEAVGLMFLVEATSPAATVLFLLIQVVNLVFYHLLKAPTLLGRQMLDRFAGFADFLSVTEKDRMNFFNPPDRTPELFEKFLPFAVALDVENAWAEQFSNSFANAHEGPWKGQGYRPTWYQGRHFNPADLGGFSTSLGRGFTSAISSAATAPGSSSGSSGGGSSGGGGGGGGGGGW
ncbi:DUF2207 domain-containing protein [Sneathiella sp. CAU 1612]|uniref:DUF2207 domain-containing protein n=1 Tax=Sneathiella sedimenti TaxID=2816034 RepID=A0ABS3F661_9PROT|nr:DUF2207 domain-containing protein [Sneathiella sedimenti]MBO0333864.1 DUF2207 domain-containing protein [Sneathiella sedimenti]